MSNGAKIGLAVAAGLALLLIAVIIANEPWHSQKYKDCAAEADRDGFRGEERDQVIKFCVDYPGPATVPPPRQTVLVPVPVPQQPQPYPPGVTVCDPLGRWDPDCDLGKP